MTPVRTDRAVSTAVNYVLLLGIVTLLVAVLLVGTANVVQGEQEEAVLAGLNVVGHNLAADLQSTSALVASVEESGEGRLAVALPTDIAGVPYRVDITSIGGDRYELQLTTTAGPDVTTSVTFVSATPITQPVTLDGGDVYIRWEASESADTIEVYNG